MNILTEPTIDSQKFIIFGKSGIGKTTLASKLNKPLLLDIEGGANFLSIPRTEQITNLEVFYNYLVELYKTEKLEFENIIIDSADWLTRLIVEKVAGIDKKNLDKTLNSGDLSYGKGTMILENHVRSKLLPMLVALNKKGYGICLIAHADIKDVLGDDGSTVERITPKIDPRTMNVMTEWCDGVFYLKKNIAGERVLQVEGDETALAKNRLGLRGDISLENNDINDILKGNIKE